MKMQYNHCLSFELKKRSTHLTGESAFHRHLQSNYYMITGTVEVEVRGGTTLAHAAIQLPVSGPVLLQNGLCMITVYASQFGNSCKSTNHSPSFHVEKRNEINARTEL